MNKITTSLIKKVKSKFNTFAKKIKKYEEETSSVHYGYGGYGHGNVEMHSTVGGKVFVYEAKITPNDERAGIVSIIDLQVGSGVKFPNKWAELKDIEIWIRSLREKYQDKIKIGWIKDGTNYWEIRVLIFGDFNNYSKSFPWGYN